MCHVVNVPHAAVCNHIKDTKIHQITTGDGVVIPAPLLYVITSKIQKFIKSQRYVSGTLRSLAVCNHIKDTKIHQITTECIE